MAIWIRGGTLINPEMEKGERRDILIENEKVNRIIPPGEVRETGADIQIINAEGKLVVPGLIDMHVHFREPGHEYKETIESGGLAAVKGGFTAVACMPNTNPVNDSSAVTEFMIKRAREVNLVRVCPIAAITIEQKGEVLTDFGDLKNAGAVGVSDDGFPVRNSQIMRSAIEYAEYHKLTVISHCEDTDLTAGGVMHEGKISTLLGLQGIPAAAEEIMIQREILLSKLTGKPVHIAHVSTEGSVDLIRRAKENDIPVTAETAPHYFTLDHSAVQGYNTNAKMNPPLRLQGDVQAIKRGLSEGVIDAVATDHAPHSSLEKDLEFDKAAFGIIGLETAVPLTLALVREGILSLPGAIGKLSLEPAKILGLEGGRLREGGIADLAIIDTECEYVLKIDDIISKSRNSPFIGMTLKGKSVLTMIGGRIVWSEQTTNSRR